MSAECPIPVTRTTVTTDAYRSVSLAYSLTESQYDTIKREAGGNALYQGIPLGANYSDYQRSVQSRAERLKFSGLEKYSYAYSTVGMTPTDLVAYKACLARNGLGLFAENIGDESYTISIQFTNPATNESRKISGSLGDTINIKSESIDTLKKGLAAASFGSNVDRQFSIEPEDPKKEAAVEVRVGSSYSRVLNLPPLVQPPAPRLDLGPDLSKWQWIKQKYGTGTLRMFRGYADNEPIRLRNLEPIAIGPAKSDYQWRLYSTGYRTYKIQAYLRPTYINAGHPQDPNAVVNFDHSTSEWIFEYADDEWFRIRSKADGRYISKTSAVGDIWGLRLVSDPEAAEGWELIQQGSITL